MAYHVGRLFQRHFGFNGRVVKVGTEKPRLFRYPELYDALPLAKLASVVRPDDWVIINPSFSSHEFGLRLPCHKLMYIQGYNTYSVIDGFCDAYAAVSGFVQQFIKMVYGFAPPVIPAFAQLE